MGRRSSIEVKNTARQLEVLAALFPRDGGLAPSFKELADRVGMRTRF